MKALLLLCLAASYLATNAQSTSEFVEGGKTLIELIKVFKKPVVASLAQVATNGDSCSFRKQSNILFRNKMDNTIQVTLYFRNGTSYESQPMGMRISARSNEQLFDIRSGVYKYKVESEIEGVKTVIHEGELKLQPCEHAIRDVKGM
jgi:hypothetical protein